MEGAFQQKTKKQTPNKLKREQKRSYNEGIIAIHNNKRKKTTKKRRYGKEKLSTATHQDQLID